MHWKLSIHLHSQDNNEDSHGSESNVSSESFIHRIASRLPKMQSQIDAALGPSQPPPFAAFEMNTKPQSLIQNSFPCPLTQ